MKSRLTPLALLLPASVFLICAGLMANTTLTQVLQLKNQAHGSGSATIEAGRFNAVIPSDRFLNVGFDRAGTAMEEPITIINVPGVFVGALVSFLVPRTEDWQPASLMSSTWHCFTLPLYALPAWFFVGRGLDGLRRRNRIGLGNMILSLILTLACAALSCAFGFGISEAERAGQERLIWSIVGLAIWAVLFAMPLFAWLRQRSSRHWDENTKS